MAQCVDEQIGILPTVETEGHFVQIGLQMLGADLVPRSHNPALQKRERRFHGISRDTCTVLISCVFFGAVVDGFMLSLDASVCHDVLIASPIVGHQDFQVLTDILFEVLSESAGTGVGRVKETEIAFALSDTDNNLLGFHGSLDTLTALAATYVGFVHFDCTVQHWGVNLFHGRTDAMAEVPRRLVASDAQSSLDLVGRHSFACFNEKENGHKPSFQRQVRVVEDGLGSHSELVMALAAFKLRIIGEFKHFLALAAKALDAVRPAEFLEQSAARFVGRIQLSEVIESHG